MRKSKSWAPSRGGVACADTPEGRYGCSCDVDTPGAGDSSAVNDNKLSCSVASIQIERGFIGLTRKSSASSPLKSAPLLSLPSATTTELTSYRRNFMCYAVILDLTTCLHRMVGPFQQMPVQHLPPKHRRLADLAERFFRTIAESRDVDPPAHRQR